ncbi:hypothetical protein [Methyloferula stellata]|uniref:hypothetical protein n=1 Tax=Methyloferula stellata TaxID=876270 RepID=UPI000371D9B8|nr:hypothetical protein [Methyloferula stellata]
MAIPVNHTDQLVIDLDAADDRMEVLVNGNLVDSLNVGEPAKTHNLLTDFKPGLNVVSVVGIDTQIPHRSVGYRVVKTTLGADHSKIEVIVWQDHEEQTNGPGDGSPHGVWYQRQNEFELV